MWKQDLSALWTGSPHYVLVDRTLVEHPAHDIDNADPARWIAVDAIRKMPTGQAWADADPYVAAGVYARVSVKPFRKVLPA